MNKKYIFDVNTKLDKAIFMDQFSNSILAPDDLPKVEAIDFNPLDKKYKKIIIIRLVIFYLFISGLFAGFLFISEEIPPTSILITFSILLVVLIVCSSTITILGFSKKGYLVREKDISYQKGLITYKLISVPFNRIQHVEVNQGVLAKIFKLSSVKIYTAGGNASDLSIPGLPSETAQNLKAFLSEKISEHE
jgi:membrane protein YdbS with pleckstrin-like domain